MGFIYTLYDNIFALQVQSIASPTARSPAPPGLRLVGVWPTGLAVKERLRRTGTYKEQEAVSFMVLPYYFTRTYR
jgi:hypothetical protein